MYVLVIEYMIRTGVWVVKGNWGDVGLGSVVSGGGGQPILDSRLGHGGITLSDAFTPH